MPRFDSYDRGSCSSDPVRQLRGYFQNALPVSELPLRDIYRHGWTPEQYNAINLLVKEKPHVIDSRPILHITFKCLGGSRHYIGKKPWVEFRLRNQTEWEGKAFPSASFDVSEVKDRSLQARLIRWAAKAFYYERTWGVLHTWLQQIVVSDPIINTIGQLHAVWPEVVPFTPVHLRETKMNAKRRSPIKLWNDEDIQNFRNNPDIQEVNKHLLVLALIGKSYDIDWSYPDIYYRAN